MHLVDFIVCEDIRHELRNKFSLVGIFGEEINFHGIPKDVQWPIPFRLGVLLRLKLDHGDEFPESFELVIKHNEEIDVATFEGEISLKDEMSLISIPLSAQIFPIHGQGILSFSLKIMKGKMAKFECVNYLKVNIKD